MTKKTLTALLVSIVVVVFIVVWLFFAQNCPNAGIALTDHARELHRLKNRTAFPQATDFDPRVTLDELLRPGDDRSRWSTGRAARIQGEVVDVAYARPEATNCYNPYRRDIHILVAPRKDAPKNEHVVVEVTPYFQGWAPEMAMDWSEQALQADLVGHWCEFEGWLYFDDGHSEESENIAPRQPDNWRATAWELHPVTKITVVK